MKVAALLIMLSLTQACLVEGRCVVQVAPSIDGKAAVDVKIADGAQLVGPKESRQVLDALGTLGTAAIKAALALFI